MRIVELGLNEYKVIGSAVRKDEIPQKYRSLPFLGRGATSLVYDYDQTHVLIFTRDTMKMEWLVRELGIAEYIDEFDTYHPNAEIRQLPIMILKCEKLQKLDSENRKKVMRIVKEFNNMRQKSGYGKLSKQKLINAYQELFDQYSVEFTTQHEMEQFISFISNFDERQYEFDLGTRNFMQNANGEIIMNDPVVSSEIIQAFTKRR